MGKFNTYRYLVLKDEGGTTHAQARALPRPPPRSLRRLFLLLVVVVIGLTYFMGFVTTSNEMWEGVARSMGYSPREHYAVIIDAGSSGSRVLAYKFRVPFSVFGSSGLELVDEYFEQSKPGLSSYADDPQKGAGTIVQLIKSAAHFVPESARAGTPLVVRATAGLRLLPTQQAHALTHHVSRAIRTLGYNVADDAVKVMEGSDEGIFIWYTINLLHDTMGIYDSMAALDLGGGSTQITYRLNQRETLEVPAADRFLVPYGGRNITLYTHSYLKLGLLAARYGVFRMEADDDETTNFTSVCVDPIVRDEPWLYANVHYTISGAARPPQLDAAQALERCRALVRRYVLRTLDWEPERPPRATLAAMSYFYDVAADAGIIDVMRGGDVKVGAYLEGARRACAEPNVDQPWACLDLVYITSLLHDAYKMDLDKEISLFKKVKGHEVSWALGLAYTTLSDLLLKSAPR